METSRYIKKVSENNYEPNFEELNKMPAVEIAAWIEDRFMRYNPDKLPIPDCFGFSLGAINRALVMSFPPNKFLTSAYKAGDEEFKERFSDVLRSKLEEKLKEVDEEINKREIGDIANKRLNYIHHGLETIGFAPVEHLSGFLASLIDKKYDFEFPVTKFTLRKEKPTFNIYKFSVGYLALMNEFKADEAFWDQFLDDERLFVSVLTPKSFPAKLGLERFVKNFNRVHEMLMKEEVDWFPGVYAFMRYFEDSTQRDSFDERVQYSRELIEKANFGKEASSVLKGYIEISTKTIKDRPQSEHN